MIFRDRQQDINAKLLREARESEQRLSRLESRVDHLYDSVSGMVDAVTALTDYLQVEIHERHPFEARKKGES